MYSAPTIIPIGNYDWYVLRQMGDKYFVLAESPLFRGYYALKNCGYADSKLAAFLNNKFLSRLTENGVDASKISNIGILSVGQYQLYVKDKLPVSASPFLLQTQHPTAGDCVIAVNSAGELYPEKITNSCGIRPCMFVNRDYVVSLIGFDPLQTGAESEIPPMQDILTTPITSVAVPTTDVSDPVNRTEPEPTGVETVIEPESDGTEMDTTEVTDDDQSSDSEVTDGQSGEPEQSEEETERIVLEQIQEETTGSEEVQMETEQEIRQIQTEDRTVHITSVGNQNAAYVFEEPEYDRFAVLYEGEEDELQKLLREYGVTVSAFCRSSLVPDRKKPSAEEVQAFMEQQMNRFRWRNQRR